MRAAELVNSGEFEFLSELGFVGFLGFIRITLTWEEMAGAGNHRRGINERGAQSGDGQRAMTLSAPE